MMMTEESRKYPKNSLTLALENQTEKQTVQGKLLRDVNFNKGYQYF